MWGDDPSSGVVCGNSSRLVETRCSVSGDGLSCCLCCEFFFCTHGGTCGGGGGGHCGNGGDGIRKDSHSRCGGTGGWIRIVRKKQKTQETATKRAKIRDWTFAMLKFKNPMFQFKPCDSIVLNSIAFLQKYLFNWLGWWDDETDVSRIEVWWLVDLRNCDLAKEREGVASKCRTFVYCRLRSGRYLHVFTVGRFRFHPDSKAGLVPSCRPVFFLPIMFWKTSKCMYVCMETRLLIWYLCWC